MELTATKYEQTEVGLIPQGWEIKELGQLAKVIGGGTPKTTVAGYWNGKISWFTPTEVGKQKYLITSNRKITLEGLHSSSAQILPIGTILLTSRAGIGDLGILTKEAATNQGFQSLLVYDEYDNEYVYYLLSTLKPKLLSRASGSTFLEISPSKVKEIRVGVPSTLTEQKAIAHVLTDTDALIQALEKKISKKELIKKGVMQKLLTPKEGWEEKSLGEVGEGIIGLTYSPNDVRKNGTLVLRSSNVQKGQLVFIDNVFVEMDLPDRVIVKENDILICVRNGSKRLIGKCTLIDKKTVGSAFGAFMTVYRSQYSKYVFYVFQSHYIQRQIDEVMGATINQITNKDLNSFVIPFPPVEEQKKIVQILSDLDVEIQHLIQKKAKYKLAKQGMIQQLLTGKTRLV